MLWYLDYTQECSRCSVPERRCRMNAETKRGVVKWLVREVIAGSVIVGLTLFIPAGTLNWPMGWALVGV